MKYLKLVRWKNLIMIALVQLLIKYALLEPFGAQTSLGVYSFLLLIIASVTIAAAGNIINDINDVDTDTINKPDNVIIGKSISEKTAYNLFIALNIIGVSAGYAISNLIDKNGFFALFVIISILLYVYATYLKQLVLIGNIIISLLVALSLLIVGVFDLIPTITAENQLTQWFFFKIISDYALFAFSVNLLREITKDIEDMDGDYSTGMRTLPIVIGRQRTKVLLIMINVMVLFGCIFYTINKLYKYPIATVYFMLVVIGPMLYNLLKIIGAKSKEQYNHISLMLKLIMLSGILSLLLYRFVIL